MARAFVTISVSALGLLTAWLVSHAIAGARAYAAFFFILAGAGAVIGMALNQAIAPRLPVPWRPGPGRRASGPPPRRARLTTRAMMRIPTYVLLMGGICAIPLEILRGAWFRISRGGAWSDESLLVALAFLMPLAWLWWLLRQRHLVARGETTVGLVESRTTPSRGDPRVLIRFETSGGPACSRSAADRDYGIQQGMSVPVFYDPAKPKKCVAACESYFEVVED
jgi:hypothetical protein